jgi:hypothetical protein
MKPKRHTPRRAAKAIPATSATTNPRTDHRSRLEVVETYFDHDGRPTKRASLGAARVSRAYDSQGHQIEERYFNAEGKPIIRRDLGASRISWRYDDDGRQVDTTLFGPDDAPVRPNSAPPRKRALEQA